MQLFIKKYLVITFLLILSSSQLSAQRLLSGYGVGAHVSTASFKDSTDARKTTSFRPGFRAFWMGRVALEGIIYFAPEVGYSMKGFRVKNPYNGVSEQEIIVHTIEFLALQEYAINDKFYVKLGPSISAAFAGRDKQLSSTGLRSNAKLGFSFATWGRFEGAITIATGAHFGNGWIAELRMNRGISNNWDGDNGPNIKSRYYGITLGKYLKK
jgi:hypothetical protein